MKIFVVYYNLGDGGSKHFVKAKNAKAALSYVEDYFARNYRGGGKWKPHPASKFWASEILVNEGDIVCGH